MAAFGAWQSLKWLLLENGQSRLLADCALWLTYRIAAIEDSRGGRTAAYWRRLLLTLPAIKSHSTAKSVGPVQTGERHSTFKAGWLYLTPKCPVIAWESRPST